MKTTELTTKATRMPVEMRINEMNLTARKEGEFVTCPMCGKKHIKTDMHPSCCSKECQDHFDQLVRHINRRDRSKEREFNAQLVEGKNYQKRMLNFQRGIGF